VTDDISSWSEDDWFDSDYMDAADYRNVHGASSVGDFTWGAGDSMNAPSFQDSWMQSSYPGLLDNATQEEQGVIDDIRSNPSFASKMQMLSNVDEMRADRQTYLDTVDELKTIDIADARLQYSGWNDMTKGRDNNAKSSSPWGWFDGEYTLDGLQEASKWQSENWADTDDFGNPISTDAFGNYNFDAKQQHYVDTKNENSFVNDKNSFARDIAPDLNLPGILGEVPNTKAAPTKDGWNEFLNTRVLDTAGKAVEGTLKNPATNWYNNLEKSIQGVTDFNPDQAAAGQAAGNFIPSLATEVGGVIDMISSPVETGQALVDLLSGTFQHVTGFDYNQNDKEMASALGNAVLQDYGSIDGFTKTLSERPVEALAMLTGVGFISKAVAHQALKAADPITMNKVSSKFGITPIIEKDVVGFRSGSSVYDKPNPNQQVPGQYGTGHYMFLDEKDAAAWPGSTVTGWKFADNYKDITIDWGGKNSNFVNNAFKGISREYNIDFPDDFHAENYFTLAKEIGEREAQATLREYGIIGNRGTDGTVMIYHPDDVSILTRGGEYVGGIKNPLIAQHNLTESSLLKQEKGLPMPSMAISKAKSPMTSFGEVSLLAHPDLITPGAKAKAYSTDIYSGRQPDSRLEYTDKKTLKESIPESTLDFYGYYTVDNLTPGGLEAKVAVTPVYEELGYKTSDFASFALMRRQAESDGHYVPEPHITPEQYLGEVRHAIVNPKGQYTPTGKKRDTVEWTPEAAHKVMKDKKAHLPGTEGLKGAGQARALTATQFKTLDAIKKSRDDIVDEYQFDPLAGEADFKSYFTAHYSDAMEDVERLGAKLDDGYMPSFRYEDIIEDSIKGADLSWTGWPDEAIAKVTTITNQLKDIADGLPTEYFEVKRTDIVDVSKFKGAIIPEYAKKAEELLKSKGIEKIYKYGTDAERKSLFDKFPELYFSKVAMPTGAGLGALSITEEADAEHVEGILSVLESSDNITEALTSLLDIEDDNITIRGEKVNDDYIDILVGILGMTEEELKELVK